MGLPILSQTTPLDTPPKENGYSGEQYMFDLQGVSPFVPSRPHLFGGRIAGPQVCIGSPMRRTDLRHHRKSVPGSRLRSAGLGALPVPLHSPGWVLDSEGR